MKSLDATRTMLTYKKIYEKDLNYWLSPGNTYRISTYDAYFKSQGKMRFYEMKKFGTAFQNNKRSPYIFQKYKFLNKTKITVAF